MHSGESCTRNGPANSVSPSRIPSSPYKFEPRDIIYIRKTIPEILRSSLELSMALLMRSVFGKVKSSHRVLSDSDGVSLIGQYLENTLFSMCVEKGVFVPRLSIGGRKCV